MASTTRKVSKKGAKKKKKDQKSVTDALRDRRKILEEMMDKGPSDKRTKKMRDNQKTFEKMNRPKEKK